MTSFLDPIRIAFTLDGGYAMPLASAIVSIATNVRCDKKLVFHVFYQNFGQALQEQVARSLVATGNLSATIIWQKADLTNLRDLRVVHSNHNSLIYLRLLLPDLMPLDAAKVIYLDADLVVLDDISKLWEEPSENWAVLAVRDRIGTVDSPQGLTNFRDLGIPPNAAYFNSGVMVFNLARWRHEGLTCRILQYIHDHPNDLQMGDQDGLNAVLFDKWRELDFRWNWQVVPDRRRAVEAGCWGLDRTEKSIVHFVTSAKPWLPGNSYAERHLFFHYLDKTAWRGWRVPAMLSAKTRLKRLLWPVVARLRSWRRPIAGGTP